MENSILTLAALGDLMVAGEWDETVAAGRTEEAFRELQAALGSDLVFANLETTIKQDEGLIPKEPRVVAARETLRACLEAIGVDVANLANNHSFDGYLSGFESVRGLLEELGISHFGAGSTQAEASRPLLMERNGVRLAWLGCAAGSTHPSHIAGPSRFGVNPLDGESLFAELRRMENMADHRIVSLHWGVEYCNLPAPEQIRFARQLVDHGASLVLGHHAHVVQGVERYRDSVIAYNLGNATTCDFFIGSRRAIRQTPRTRSSFVLRLNLARDRIMGLSLIPFRFDKGKALVEDARSRKYLEKASRDLHDGVSQARWRRRRVFEDLVLRPLAKVHPAVIGSVRPRHLVEFVSRLLRNLGGRPHGGVR